MSGISPPAIGTSSSTTDVAALDAFGPTRSTPSANDLPSEVLAHVFAYLVEIRVPLRIDCFIIDENGEWQDGNTDKLGWIKVTHVCRRWRKVALENPTLWSDITFMLGPKWTATMMERAQTAPITINRNSGDEKYKEEEDYIPKHIWHIQRFSMDAPGDVLGPLLEATVQPATILELLELSVSGSRQAPFPQVPFAGSTPRLQRLVLKGWSIPWDSSIFGAWIVDLEIGYPEKSAESIPTLAQLSAAFERMPKLESLELRYALPPHTHATKGKPGVPRVSLPRLHELKLTGTVRDCAQLVESLDLPATADLCFHNLLSHGMSDDFDRIIPLLASRCYESGGAVRDLQSIRVSIFGSELDIHVCLPWGTHRNGKGRRTVFSVQFILPIASPTIADHTELLHKLLTRLPLDGVKVAKLTSYDHGLQFTVDDWLRVLGGMNNLEDVQVSDVGAMLFCEALVVDAKDYLDLPSARITKIRLHRPDNVFLPRLAKLTLERVDFRGKFWGGSSMFHVRLVALLKARKKWDHPLKELDIDKCDIIPSWASKFADVVETVTWDTIDDGVSGKWL